MDHNIGGGGVGREIEQDSSSRKPDNKVKEWEKSVLQGSRSNPTNCRGAKRTKDQKHQKNDKDKANINGSKPKSRRICQENNTSTMASRGQEGPKQQIEDRGHELDLETLDPGHTHSPAPPAPTPKGPARNKSKQDPTNGQKPGVGNVVNVASKAKVVNNVNNKERRSNTLDKWIFRNTDIRYRGGQGQSMRTMMPTKYQNNRVVEDKVDDVHNIHNMDQKNARGPEDLDKAEATSEPAPTLEQAMIIGRSHDLPGQARARLNESHCGIQEERPGARRRGPGGHQTTLDMTWNYSIKSKKGKTAEDRQGQDCRDPDRC